MIPVFGCWQKEYSITGQDNMILYILYDANELSRKNKAPILAYTIDFEGILSIKEDKFPSAALYMFEGNEDTTYKQIGRIKCHTCGKDVLVVDNILPPRFPFCSKPCQWGNLLDLLEAGEEEQVDETDYSSIG